MVTTCCAYLSFIECCSTSLGWLCTFSKLRLNQHDTIALSLEHRLMHVVSEQQDRLIVAPDVRNIWNHEACGTP